MLPPVPSRGWISERIGDRQCRRALIWISPWVWGWLLNPYRRKSLAPKETAPVSSSQAAQTFPRWLLALLGIKIRLSGDASQKDQCFAAHKIPSPLFISALSTPNSEIRALQQAETDIALSSNSNPYKLIKKFSPL